MLERKSCPPRVSIIILNWNNAEDTLACLDSVAALDYPAARVIVVDNGSTDDSAARIRAAYPDVELIETGENLGYAGGNNVGIRHALAQGADYVCILNNDVIVDPGFLGPLVDALQAEADVGVVTPLAVERTEGSGRVWALGLAVNRRTAAVTRLHAGQDLDVWRGRLPFEVEVASGAAMVARREVLERAGLMDEEFFLYYEEVDWCLSLHGYGYRILAVPASVVWHKVSGTLGVASPQIDYYMLRNHLRLICRRWFGIHRSYLCGRVVVRNLVAAAAFTLKSHSGQRIPNRDARLLALRDAILGRWGKMGPDVAKVCYPNQ